MLDFGIAKVMSDDRQVPALTAVGQTLGTLEFMSPEQLRGQQLDGRSDIYALGMMAYEMLTGKLPFQSAKSPIDIINFHMKQPAAAAVEARRHRSTIPAAVDAIILKMVAKDREDRFADANALREEIARAQRALDRSPDRFEAYRVVGVVGAVAVARRRAPWCSSSATEPARSRLNPGTPGNARAPGSGLPESGPARRGVPGVSLVRTALALSNDAWKKRRQRMDFSQAIGVPAPRVWPRDHQTISALPLMRSCLTVPQTRESEELSRLSPITNTLPAGRPCG